MPGPDLLCASALSAFLLVASVIDLRTRRIPNWLVGSGMLCALAVHALAPKGNGLFDFWWGSPGLTQPLFGVLAGLALFMPLHLLRAVGAGDVKLLAMVGAWLGPQLLLGATLLTLVAGGVMSVVVMLASRSSRQVLENVRLMLTTSMIGAQTGNLTPLHAPMLSQLRLPYALAITLGTVAELAWLLTHAGP